MPVTQGLLHVGLHQTKPLAAWKGDKQKKTLGDAKERGNSPTGLTRNGASSADVVDGMPGYLNDAGEVMRCC